MTTDYAAIKDNVDEILKAAGVSFTVRYVGETSKTEGKEKPWQCDAWKFCLQKDKQKYEGDYFTGLGHRKAAAGAPADKGRPNTLYREDWDKRYLKPQAPRAADVLHSLVLDSSANDMSFRDWCGDYGYSDDSLSALDTYRQCCNIAVELKRVFDHKTLDAVRDAVQDL